MECASLPGGVPGCSWPQPDAATPAGCSPQLTSPSPQVHNALRRSRIDSSCFSLHFIVSYKTHLFFVFDRVLTYLPDID